MHQFSPDPLNAEELAALRQIASGSRNWQIPPHVQNRLKLSGYVTEISIGLVATTEGEIRLRQRD